MNKVSIHTLLTGAVLVLSCVARPAFADYLQTYVATTCDASTGRGMVRFGYGDADDPPKFDQVAQNVDGGLSQLPITNADKTQASCLFPTGREIKVRYEMGEGDGDTSGEWSVWVDKIRITHGDGRLWYPFAVIVEKQGFRVCKFHLAQDQWPYDLTSAVRPDQRKPAPIECDDSPARITGPRDEVEYPKDGSKPSPPAGSILVAQSTDAALCQSLVESNGDSPGEIDISGVGEPADEAKWASMTYIRPGVPGATEHVDRQDLDVLNAGTAQHVFRVNSGHTFTSTFYVVAPSSISITDLVAQLSKADWFENIPAIARGRGWTVLGWEVDPIKALYFDIGIVRIKSTTYLLATPETKNGPAGVLWKARPDGTLQQVCLFEAVKPHL